jgi:uncharacterized protein YkwD
MRSTLFAVVLSLSVGGLVGCGGPLDTEVEIDDSEGAPTSSTQSDEEDATSSGLTSTLVASADTTVRSGSYANSNYGTGTTVTVDGVATYSTVREAFFQFSVGSLPAGTTAVNLVLSTTESGVIGTLYRTGTFNESTLTWNTRPAKGVAVASGGLVGSGVTLRLNVKAAVTGPGTYAFVLSSTSSDGLTFRSRQATSGRPYLEFISTGTLPTPDAGTPPVVDAGTPDAGPAPTGCAGVGSTLECEAFALINQQRAVNGLAPYAFNAKLRNASVFHNNWMTAYNCFAHVCTGEPGVGTRITNAGYNWSTYGETIAAGYGTAAAVVNGWMNSPGHRAILLGNYRDIGVAVKPCTSGCSYSPYWTADFGISR